MLEDGKLGKYVVAGTLGRGAMGTVYDGRDPVIDRRVAIKTIPLASAEDAEGAEALARFRREAQAAGRLQHPNLVGVYDYGETETLAYIVMEFVDGTSLKAVLDKQERFAPAETVRIMEQVLAGLQYSHARGVVHRDIKPANIMITRDGVVKIADFGIARIESSSLTQAGTIMGTPAYMSPEQFMGTTVDARTDIYSAGVMLYQMLTGERPFEGSMTGIMHKALNTEPPKPSAISVTSPVGLDAVVARAMAKRPEQRFADAAAFAAALRAGLTAPAVADAESEATMVSVPGQRAAALAPKEAAVPLAAEPAAKTSRSRVPVYAVLGVAALLLAGAAAFFVLQPDKAPAPAQGNPKTVMPPPPLPQKAAQPTASVIPLQPALPLAAAPRPAATSADPRTALTAALSDAACSLVSGTLDDNHSLWLYGIVGWEQDKALERAIRQAVPDAVLASSPDVFHGPYCKITDLLRPFLKPLSPDRSVAISLVDAALKARDSAPLKAGELMIPRLITPPFLSYLTVDYFSSDGEVSHIYPRTGDHIRAYAPSDATTFRRSEHGLEFQVEPPFGTDLLVVIASQSPLFAWPRPDSDTLKTYLPALRQALADASRDGDPIALGSMVVHTVSR